MPAWRSASARGKPERSRSVSPDADVRPKLILHLRVQIRSTHECADAETKRIEDSHTSSGCAASAAPIAVASPIPVVGFFAQTFSACGKDEKIERAGKQLSLVVHLTLLKSLGG